MLQTSSQAVMDGQMDDKQLGGLMFGWIDGYVSG